MYITFAFASAILVGISAIFSKLALQHGQISTVNSACNAIVLLCFLGDVILSRSLSEVFSLANWWAILLSAVTLALSWEFYFQGLKKGPVSIVMGIQNLSIPMTLLMSLFFLAETITLIMILASAFILIGAILMLDWNDMTGITPQGGGWLLPSLLAALFVALSYIFTKVDAGPVSSSVSGMIRYALVVVSLLGIHTFQNRWISPGNPAHPTDRIPSGLLFWLQVLLSGAFLGIGYVFLYRAIDLGSVTISTTIYRLNIVAVAVMSALIFKEAMSRRKVAGIALMIVGLILFTIAS